MTNLPRKLGLFSAVAVLTGTTIGSGIFRSPAGVAEKVPDPKLFLAVWIVGGLCVLAGALTYAELAAAFPHTGGLFVYLREAFGRLPAFLFGWANLTIIRAAAAGAIATVFAEYMLRMFGISDVAAVHYVAAIAILLLAGFNSAGIRLAAGVQNVTASMKYFALVILVVASFLSGGNAAFPAQAVPVPSSGPATIGIFGLALISVLWVYDGWADVTFIGGEIRRPERYLPLSLMIGTFAVIAIYLAAIPPTSTYWGWRKSQNLNSSPPMLPSVWWDESASRWSL